MTILQPLQDQGLKVFKHRRKGVLWVCSLQVQIQKPFVVFSSSDEDLSAYSTPQNDFFIAATPTATPICEVDSDSNYLSHCSKSVINTVTYDKCSYSFVIPGYTAYVGIYWPSNNPLEWFNLTYFWTVPAVLTCSSSSSQLPNNANNYWTGFSFSLSEPCQVQLH